MSDPRTGTSDRKIDKGIPIPPKAPSGHIAAWRQMEIGDSIFYAGETIRNLRLAGSWNRYSKLNDEIPRKFLSRRVDGGYRIWRTA